MNRRVLAIILSFLHCGWMWGQNLSSAGRQVVTRNGLCLDLEGDVERYTLDGHEYVSGNFLIQDCEGGKVFAEINDLDRLSIQMTDSCLILDYFGFFFNPQTNSYTDFQSFRTVRICKNRENAISSREQYHFEAPSLSGQDVAAFVQHLDSVFRVDSVLLDRVNGYGFVDMLFYCSLRGEEQARFYFVRLIEILDKRNLLSEYGGEPAQIYRCLKLIYDHR